MQSSVAMAVAIVAFLLCKEVLPLPALARGAAEPKTVECSQTNPNNFPLCKQLTTEDNTRKCYKVRCTGTQCMFNKKPKNIIYAERDIRSNNMVEIDSPQRGNSQAYPSSTFCIYKIIVPHCQNKTEVFLPSNVDVVSLSSGDWVRLYVADNTYRDLEVEFGSTNSSTKLYDASSFMVYFYADRSGSTGGFHLGAQCSDIPLTEPAGSGGNDILDPNDPE